MTVSVVIPTKDRWPLLRVALRSALEQTMGDMEVIVVDDGSSDGTAEALAEVPDPRLVVLRHGSAQGVARARNAALGRARGEWVAFLDDDDAWAPAKLERQLVVAASRRADFIATLAVQVDRDGCVIGQQTPELDDLERGLLRRNVVGGPSSVMVASRLLERVGGFDEALSVLADWELWLRLAPHCRPALVEEPLTALADHGGNMQITDIDRVLDELRHIKAVHAGRLEELGMRFGSPRLLEYLAHYHRRAGNAAEAASAYRRLARHRPLFGSARALVCVAESATGRRLPSRPQPRKPPPGWLAALLAAPGAGVEPSSAPR